MPMNTPFLGSGLTTQYTGSDQSFAGQVYCSGALVAASSFSVTGASSFASVAAGAGNAPFTVSTVTRAIVAMSVTGNKSVTTTVAFSGATTTGATTNPVIYIATPSGMSDDVILDVLPTSTNTVTLRYSNVSTVTAAVAANTVRVTQIRF